MASITILASWVANLSSPYAAQAYKAGNMVNGARAITVAQAAKDNTVPLAQNVALTTPETITIADVQQTRVVEQFSFDQFEVA